MRCIKIDPSKKKTTIETIAREILKGKYTKKGGERGRKHGKIFRFG